MSTDNLDPRVSPERRAHGQAVRADVEKLWLTGVPLAAIADSLGLTLRRVQQIVQEFRPLLNAGGYDEQLAALAAQQISGIPRKGQKAGRPAGPLTDTERAILDDRERLKLGRRKLAAKYGLTPDQVRYILTKRTADLEKS